MSRIRKRRVPSPITLLLLLIVASLVTTACSLFNQQTVLLRSDMPLQGLKTSVNYTLESNPGGTSEINRAILQGMNGESPMPQLVTEFTKANDTLRSQLAQATTSAGEPITALGMTQAKITFGLSEYLEVSSSTYDLRDAQGERACGSKIRMNFKPNGEQFIKGDLGKGWDAIWYYIVPCTNQETQQLDLSNARFQALVITEQFTPRITGKPLFFNRGHSVTIVGGEASRFIPGWWLANARSGSNHSVLGAEQLIRAIVSDLDTDQNTWLKFSSDGRFRDSALIYSAGDADVFFSADKQFLNREVDYVVNFRGSPTAPWRQIIVHPVYNYEWNDFAQNWEAFKDFNPLDIDEKLDEHGIPEDPNDPVLKEVETAGCQNCPNVTLEQIQLIDSATGKPLYATTLRGYIGAKNTLVMFGRLPGAGVLQQQLDAAESRREMQGLVQCPARYDAEGNPLDSSEQWSDENCAELLREGAMWPYITQHPDEFGFDLVSQYNVRDNGTWADECTGSGESMSCSLVAIERASFRPPICLTALTLLFHGW